MTTERYRIGDFVLDVGAHVISRRGVAISLPPLSFDLLLTLVRHAPNLVTSRELEDEVWTNQVVGPATIAKRVALLREALGDNADSPTYVGVVRGCGYRLLTPVRRLDSPDTQDGLSAEVQHQEQLRPGLATLFVSVGVVALIIALAVLMKSWNEGDSGASSNLVAEERMSKQQDMNTSFPDRSIAVLPFAILGNTADDRYIADGIAEEVINLLVAMETLDVVARTSSFAFRDTGQTVDVIAKKLRVNHILEGSVRRQRKLIRVTAQLIDANTGYHLWSQEYDRPLTDIFAVQDDIALNIATALEVKLTEEEQPNSADSLTNNVEAYALFLQGRNLLHERLKLGLSGIEAAIASFESAVREDSSFAHAWAGLSAALWLRPAFRDGENRSEDDRQAELAARTALEIDPDLSSALAVLGGIHWRKGDFGQSKNLFDRALNQPVQDSNVRLWAGVLFMSVGYLELGHALYEEANLQDPLNQTVIGFLASSLQTRGEPEKALSLYRAQKSGPWKKLFLGRTSLAMGEFNEARALLSDLQVPVGTLPAQYVDQVVDAAAERVPAEVAETAILEASNSGLITQRVAFELLWLMNSPVLLDVGTDYPAGLTALRVASIAWSDQGSKFRRDERFHSWCVKVGLVDFWNVHGWPPECEAVTADVFECR